MTDQAYVTFPASLDGVDEKSTVSQTVKLEETVKIVLQSHSILIQEYQEELRKVKSGIKLQQVLLYIWAALNAAAIIQLLFFNFN